MPVSPLIWSAPRPQANLSPDVLTSFDAADRVKLHEVEREVRILSQLLPLFPSNLSTSDWRTLLECPSLKHRLDHLKFLRKCELEKEKDLKRKLSRRNDRLLSESPEFKESPYTSVKESLFNIHPAVCASWERNYSWLAQERAFRLADRPNLVVDCRFLADLSPRGANLTATQLRYLISSNRLKKHPWPLYFLNWMPNNPRYSFFSILCVLFLFLTINGRLRWFSLN